MKKRLAVIVVALAAAFGLYYAWYVHWHYRFEAIVPGKVYKSALIDPDDLEDFLIEHKIHTVIDLLDPGVQDALNPAQQRDIDAEAAAVARINAKHHTDIRHVNIPSGQIPTKKTLTKFFEVLDDNTSYPVLIHCYHGTGRAVIYSALYRIEYEGWSNEAARMKTRALPFLVESPLHKSSFAAGHGKGDFLIHYKPRREGNRSTIATLEEGR